MAKVKLTIEITKDSALKGYKLLPEPEVVYQYKESGVDDIQDRLDRAFNLLFEATRLSMSTKASNKKL